MERKIEALSPKIHRFFGGQKQNSQVIPYQISNFYSCTSKKEKKEEKKNPKSQHILI